MLRRTQRVSSILQTHSDQICGSAGFLCECVFILRDNKALVKTANAKLAQECCFTNAGVKEQELVGSKVIS